MNEVKKEEPVEAVARYRTRFRGVKHEETEDLPVETHNHLLLVKQESATKREKTNDSNQQNCSATSPKHGAQRMRDYKKDEGDEQATGAALAAVRKKEVVDKKGGGV